MPWTFAHPAAVLPLRRLADAGYLSLPAMLMGCITPDVVYHIGLWQLGWLTHSPIGVLLVDVPIGLLLLFCSAWLRAPVSELLPQPHRRALLSVDFVARGKNRFVSTLVSVAIGAGTHLLWDAFTHHDAFFVGVFAWLGWPVRAFGHDFRMYKLLQHGGTLVGVYALGLAYRRHLRQLPAPAAERDCGRMHGYVRLLAIAVLAFVLALPFAFAAAFGTHGEVDLYVLLVRQVAYASTSFVVLMSAIALASHSRLGLGGKQPGSS